MRYSPSSTHGRPTWLGELRQLRHLFGDRSPPSRQNGDGSVLEVYECPPSVELRLEGP